MTILILLSLFFLLLAVFLRFAMKGYSYLAHTSVLISGLILLHALLPAGLWRIVQILVAVSCLLFLVFELQVLFSARTDPDPERKYLIVLGAEVVGATPSRSLKYRLDAAERYLKRYPDSLCVVSGGKGETEEISEADCMFRVLTRSGIAAERILREDRSTSTMDNLSYSFALIRSRGDEPDGNTALLSASYHLCRAKRMAKSLGVHSVCVAAHPGNPFLAANFFIREAFGMMHLMIFRK
jgi:uncharacterized SAM-binding protein YcdF (DUF218 family)